MKINTFIFSIILFLLLSCNQTMGKREIKIGEKTILVEIANREELRTKGLMFRNSLAKDQGMLFVFEAEKKLSFWMKNTEIPLSIAYISKSGEIKGIYKMFPFDERSIISQRSVLYALEMNQGWFEENGITVGDRLIIPENL